MRRSIDLAGKSFGRLTVQKQVENSAGGKARWRCLCECGNETVVQKDNLVSGHTTSCGCFKKDAPLKRSILVDGVPSAKHPLHSSWGNMIARCTNPNGSDWSGYGGRGLTVCDRWKESFAAFVADMGPRPSPLHSIDRIDNNGNYEPGNCRWATVTEQARNRRSNRFVAVDGVKMLVVDAAESLGLSYGQFHGRLTRNTLAAVLR